MARRDPRLQDKGLIKKVYSFDKGMFSKKPQEDIPDTASPLPINCAFDDKYCLSKVWGTKKLVTGGTNEEYNRFIVNPVYTLYNYVSPDGVQYLMIQGIDIDDGKMSLYYMNRQNSYPATLTADPTRILGSGSELTAPRRLTYATYLGRMYVWNGADSLRYWNASSFRVYHDDNDEKFKYLQAHGQRLWAAGSAKNPSRLIYTDLKHHNFYHYFELDANRIDFSSAKDYSPIMWICEFKDSMLIFKVNSIYRLWGNPEDVINFDCISEGIGTINGWSVQVWNNLVYFAWKDGIWVLGDTNVAASLEDRKLQIVPNVARISSEIDDYWLDNFTLPDPFKMGQLTYAGFDDLCSELNFDAGGDASNFKADDVGIEENDEITNGSALAKVVAVSLTSGTWTGGDAVGILYVTRISGTWSNNDAIKIGVTQFATVNGDLTTEWTLSDLEVYKAPITENQDVLGFNMEWSSYPHTISNSAYQTDVTDNTWVDIRSNLGANQYVSQSFKLDATTPDTPIASGFALYWKETGDVSGDTYKVYVTDEASGNPDFGNVYAEGIITGNFLHGIEELSFDAGSSEIYIGETINGQTSGATGVVHQVIVTSDLGWSAATGYLYIKGVTGTWQDGENIRVSTTVHAVTNTGATADSSPISTGCWVFPEMQYWDNPQNLYDGDIENPPQVYIGIKCTGDDSSNKISWCYKDSDNYTGGQMVNSDDETPASQDTLDYCFKYYGRVFLEYGSFATDTLTAGSDIQEWLHLYISLNEDTLGGYTRTSEIYKVQYEVMDADSGWDWTNAKETVNGGKITGTGRYIRVRVYFTRPGSYSVGAMDSFSMESMRITYTTQETNEQLISSIVWKDNYIFSAMVADTTTTYCLDFDGTDDYCDIANHADLNPGTGDFAMSLWVNGKAADNPGQITFLAKRITTLAGNYTADMIWGMDYGGGTLKPYFGYRTANSSATTVLDETWHHIAFSVDRDGNGYVWVDGVEKLETTQFQTSTDYTSTRNAFLGLTGTGGSATYIYEYDGLMDDVSIYKRTMTQVEAEWLYNNPGFIMNNANLSCHFKMNEGTGNTAEDSSDNDHDAELGGSGHTSTKQPTWTER